MMNEQFTTPDPAPARQMHCGSCSQHETVDWLQAELARLRPVVDAAREVSRVYGSGFGGAIGGTALSGAVQALDRAVAGLDGPATPTPQPADRLDLDDVETLALHCRTYTDGEIQETARRVMAQLGAIESAAILSDPETMAAIAEGETAAVAGDVAQAEDLLPLAGPDCPATAGGRCLTTDHPNHLPPTAATVLLLREQEQAREVAQAIATQAAEPGYERIAEALVQVFDAADLTVEVYRNDEPHLPADADGHLVLARVLDKAGLIDWAAFSEEKQ